MKKSSSHAQCAKAIRNELKKLFPLTKFSVTSESFSMGDSVCVSWQDGETNDKIYEVIKKYQYGSFDGMNDSYELTNLNKDIPQTKYIKTNRKISESYFQAFFEFIKKHYKNCDHLISLDQSDELLNTYWKAWTARNLIYRILNKTDLTYGLKLEESEK